MKLGKRKFNMTRIFSPEPSIINLPKFKLGESPVWWDERNSFIFTDILDNKICLFNPFLLTTKIIKTSEPVVCIVPCNEQVLLLTYYTKICTFNIETNVVNDFFVSKETELGLRFNDGKCDHLGRFWVSGIRNESTGINSSIFVFFNNRSYLVKERNNIFLGNGLGWDKNNKLFYFTDSKKKIIFSYQYSNDPVDIDTRKSVFFELNNCNHEPDGLCVDKNGYVWSCIWNSGEILRIKPNGEIDFKIKLPVSRPTSVTFGGQNSDIMLVTTARPSSNDQKLNEPDAGKCFLYKSMPYGLPTENFKL